MSDIHQNGSKGSENPSSSHQLPHDHSQPVPLPRISLTANPKLTALLPQKLQQKLAELQPPDHVSEARQECAYQFLEEVFLPQTRKYGEMESAWLIRQAENFKDRCQAAHPLDFQNFALIASIEAKLELLLLSQAVQDDTYDLIHKGYTFLQQLIETEGDELRQI